MKIVSSKSSSIPPDPELASWIEPYLRDQLDDAQRERFEQALIADPALQELTRQAYVLSELSREFPDQLQSRHSPWRSPVFAYAMAASLGAALVALPAWWVQSRLLQQQSELSAQLEQARSKLLAVAAPQPGLAILRLGATRSETQPAALLRQSDTVRWVQLLLPRSAADGNDWPPGSVAEISGGLEQSLGRYPLHSLQSAQGPTLLFPLAAAATGQYLVAVRSDNRLLGEYRFEVLPPEPGQ